MKSNTKNYIIIWLLVMITFNVVIFSFPRIIADIDRYTGAFWIAYVFIIIMLLVQLGIGWLVFSEKNIAKRFYNLSLIRISISGLIIMGMVGSISLIVPYIPDWFAIISCMLVLAVCGIALLGAKSAINMIEKIDENTKVNTAFIRDLTSDIKILMSKSPSKDVIDELQPLYDEVRYSDPVSSDSLAEIEKKISMVYSILPDAVSNSDIKLVRTTVSEIRSLLVERNEKCIHSK